MKIIGKTTQYTIVTGQGLRTISTHSNSGITCNRPADPRMMVQSLGDLTIAHNMNNSIDNV